MAKYGKKAQEKVERAMHEMKRGELKSGKSKKTVTSRKQAIAIGLSQARKEGGKAPLPPAEKTKAKSTKAKKAATAKKTAAAKKAAAAKKKRSSSRKSTAAKKKRAVSTKSSAARKKTKAASSKSSKNKAAK
jgi:hypothetical protein